MPTLGRRAEHVHELPVHLEQLRLGRRPTRRRCCRFRFGQLLRLCFQSTSAQSVHILRDERERGIGRGSFADGFYRELGEGDVGRVGISREGSGEKVVSAKGVAKKGGILRMPLTSRACSGRIAIPLRDSLRMRCTTQGSSHRICATSLQIL